MNGLGVKSMTDLPESKDARLIGSLLQGLGIMQENYYLIQSDWDAILA